MAVPYCSLLLLHVDGSSSVSSSTVVVVDKFRDAGGSQWAGLAAEVGGAQGQPVIGGKQARESEEEENGRSSLSPVFFFFFAACGGKAFPSSNRNICSPQTMGMELEFHHATREDMRQSKRPVDASTGGTYACVLSAPPQPRTRVRQSNT